MISFPAALSYLGHRSEFDQTGGPTSKAADLVIKIRPYVPQFHSSEYLSALATGEICFVCWLGRRHHARREARAAEAKNDFRDRLRAIPKEKARRCFSTTRDSGRWQTMSRSLRVDQLSLVSTGRRSPSQETRLFVLCQRQFGEPEAGRFRKFSTTGTSLPDEATLAKLYVITARDPATQRVINRLLDAGQDGTVGLLILGRRASAVSKMAHRGFHGSRLAKDALLTMKQRLIASGGAASSH